LKKVILTGASGFIGRQCIPLLLEAGYEVYAISRKKPTEDTKGVTWYDCDLLNINEISGMFNALKPGYLLHLAWCTKAGEYLVAAENLKWLKSGLDIFESFYKNGGKRAVFAGTCFEYDLSSGFMREKFTPLSGNSLYGACKASLYNILNKYAQQVGLSFAWGRIFYLFGPFENPNRLVSYVIRALINKQAAKCSKGEQIRDFLYVSDVADAFICLLESKVHGAMNIGSGTPISIKELVDKIGQLTGNPDLIKMGELPGKNDEPPMIVADTKRLKKELLWMPKNSIDVALSKTVNWWRNNT
jgi:nucleoside-diphosphate-sugar epimerase